MYHDADNLDTAFDAGGKVSIGLTATTIVSQWTWSATLLQSSTVASKVRIYTSAEEKRACSLADTACLGFLPSILKYEH